MKRYLALLLELAHLFKYFSIKQIPREEKSLADSLAQMASDPDNVENHIDVPLELLDKPSICFEHVVWQITHGVWWGASIKRFLLTGELPANRMEARKIRMKAARYTMQLTELYKQSFSSLLFRCLAPPDADYVLCEIHEGICGNHSRELSLANKAIRVGYYWPTMLKDSMNMVRSCDKCQGNMTIQRLPAENMTRLAPHGLSHNGE